jgi:hypothetical protein
MVVLAVRSVGKRCGRRDARAAQAFAVVRVRVANW